jgi:hypothetical protein
MFRNGCTFMVAARLVLLRPIGVPHRCQHEPIPHTRLAREVEPGVVFGPRVEHFSELDVLEARGMAGVGFG